MSQFLNLDAIAIAEGIKQKKWTSVEVTEAFIEHIQRVNPYINVLTEERFAEAREEARLADEQLTQAETLGKLHGVPISMKDNVNVKGMSTILGLPHRVGKKEEQDAYIVKVLKQEGAIILCKTNTPALCFYQESENKATGLSKNPWDLSRSVGGSSGGEGALLAVGGASVGVGTDIGGSIRFPAHYNGVVAFKSGKHQINAEGVLPEFNYEEQLRMLGIGAMGKSVRDAQLLDELFTGRRRSFVNLDAYTFVIPGQIEHTPIDQSTLKVVDNVFDNISREFKANREVPLYFHDSAHIWQKVMSIEGSKHLEALLDETKKINVFIEYMKEKLFSSSTIPSKLSWAIIGSKIFKPSTTELQEIKQRLVEIDQSLDQYLTNKIVIIPTYHKAAQKHGEQYNELFSIKKTFTKYIPYISYANAWGLPSLVLPAGKDDEGMPISLQLITKNGQEDALFQFGEWFEENLYRYERCKAYDASLELSR